MPWYAAPLLAPYGDLPAVKPGALRCTPHVSLANWRTLDQSPPSNQYPAGPTCLVPAVSTC
eukprot:12418979-Karenia_brevis.AAC.1